MYKACIIDDENNSREVLELMISENHPEITISGTASNITAVSYTHLRAHETVLDLVCRLLLEKTKKYTQI